MEDSKEMADAGSFGIKLDLSCSRPIGAEDLKNILIPLLVSITVLISHDRPLIGHVKALVLTSSGFMKVNIVDLELGPEVTESIGHGNFTKGTMNLMAVVVGTTDKMVEKAMRKAIAGLRTDIRLREAAEKGNSPGDMISLE